ncbi:hypothetical protein LVY72_08060 [Arthrobacter sp. I2-34]|uniref:Integral membrane protein n=1 Tax=Arthrobacter hankyongi TaxID=2904801 RepID=A0ABS9L5A6_9MICC|nr:hypothetical protein [Arthrobacter hankyongi]MCG2621871.1 hypothetical protein [Arthrobacter hankyongi]
MTNEPSYESRHSLDEQLRAAEAGGSGGARISRSADRAGARYAAVMAGLMSLYLLVVAYVYPQDILWLDMVATAVFVAGMVVTCVRYGRRRRASSLGWSKRYSVGSALSTGLFGLGVALLVLTDSRETWLWVPYAVVTGLPLLVAGLIRGTR